LREASSMPISQGVHLPGFKLYTGPQELKLKSYENFGGSFFPWSSFSPCSPPVRNRCESPGPGFLLSTNYVIHCVLADLLSLVLAWWGVISELFCAFIVHRVIAQFVAAFLLRCTVILLPIAPASDIGIHKCGFFDLTLHSVRKTCR
jgi:hypothetical protein